MLKRQVSPATERGVTGLEKLVLADKQTLIRLLLQYESQVKGPSEIESFVEDFIAGQECRPGGSL